jgi:ATP-dependent RNA helicase DOB1
MSKDFFSNDTELFSGLLGSSSGQKRSQREELNTEQDGPQKRIKLDDATQAAVSVPTIPASSAPPTTISASTTTESSVSIGPMPPGLGAHVARQETIEEIVRRERHPTETHIPLPDDTETTKDTPKPSTSSADSVSTKSSESQPPLQSPVQQPQPQPQPQAQSVERDELSEERKLCQHEICVPDGWVESEAETTLPKKTPAKTYPFELDPFQKVGIACLERGHSVLVSAHTSAGKTVVATYAIAMALRDRQRVIYTSPIKALSNQKYRDLYEEFQDVGLMTGDITINPSASCIVMTTEILRSMLYRGSEILREVGWVVFDEIHYLRDKERGVVWEETIILLPDKIRYVFLSATIPNAREFATWIAKLHKQPCHVVYTDFRPVPLQHYIFPAGGDGLYLVVDEKGNFREENFQKALASLAPDDQRRRKLSKGNSDIYRIVKMIMERHYDPVIVFSFSKKQCETLATQMAKLDFNDENEKKLVTQIYENALDTLNEDDKKLKQVVEILPFLKRGIGIHHSGLLPLLKEVIEILFQEGLIKCLFATETFSIGLNMPAKTVVFTSVRKFDGRDFRWVSGGEYIQMSGRAGRRGKDDRGIVILMIDEKMEPSVAQAMLKGRADTLTSSFHLRYNMLLNLLRVDFMEPEEMLRRSFHQFQNDAAIPVLKQRMLELENEKSSIVIEKEEEVAEYYQLRSQIEKLRAMITAVTIHTPVHILPYLTPGRLVKVKDFGWAVVVNFHQRANTPHRDDKKSVTLGEGVTPQSLTHIVDVLVLCQPGPKHLPPKPYSSNSTEPPDIQVVPVVLTLLEAVSTLRIYMPNDLRSVESRQQTYRTLKEVIKRFPDGIPLLDPIEDMGIDDSNFKKVVRKVETLEAKLLANPAFKENVISERFQQYLRKLKIENEIKSIKKQLRKTDNVILKDELKAMKRVLRRLDYTNKDNVIELKGRVAAEINTGDELVITELIFMGFFNSLDVPHTVAILSVFVFQEKVDENCKIREDLQGPFRQIQDVARRVALVMQESKISNIDVDEYVKEFRPELIDVTFAWANGAKFSEICQLTGIFEGSIIRALRRLEELLRQLVQAAKSIGNNELETKFAEGITRIKRDIVFAASLYL